MFENDKNYFASQNFKDDVFSIVDKLFKDLLALNGNQSKDLLVAHITNKVQEIITKLSDLRISNDNRVKNIVSFKVN